MATWKRILVEGDVTGTSPIEVSSGAPTISLVVPTTTNALDDTGNDKLLVYDSSADAWTSIPVSSVQESLEIVPHIEFDLVNPSTLDDGYLAYDADKDTLVFQSEHGEIAVGETYKPVYNGTGSTILKGAVLKATGVQGERFTVELFDASSGVDEELYLIGVAQADIPNATEGVVVSEGYVKHLNTSSYSVGTILYASETAGAFTSTKPSSPNLGIPVAMVTKVDGTNGTIYVRLTLYSHLTEAHDVNISSPSNGEVLTYNSTSGVWENAAAPEGGIDTTGTITTGAIAIFTDSNTVKGDTSLFVTGNSLLTSYDIIAAGTLTVANITIGSTGTPTPAISVSTLSEDLQIISRGNVDIILDSDTNETGQKFRVNDPSTTERFSVNDIGVVRINDAYSFPPSAPEYNKSILKGDANGNVVWRLPVYDTITKTAAFTLDDDDCQKMLSCESASGFTITVPTGLPRDAEVLIYQNAPGAITVQAGTGVTLVNTSPFLNKTAEQYAIIGLKQIGDSDKWIVTGERETA